MDFTPAYWKTHGLHLRRKRYRFYADCQWQGAVMIEPYKRKTYTRSHPYPTNTQRINPLPREKAAIIMLRKHGYPINMLAKALGRSTSYIHRVIRTEIKHLTLRVIDMRKLPGQIRLRCSSKRWATLQKYLPAWEAFILGEEDEPP